MVVLGELLCFQVDLGYEGAGGVDHLESAALGLVPYGGRNPMSAEDDAAVRRDFGQFLDEDSSRVAEFLDDVAVVNDLLANVDRGSEQVESNLDYVNRPDDTGAKAARRQKQDFLRRVVSYDGTTSAQVNPKL